MAGSWPIGLRTRALVALLTVLAMGLLPTAAAPAGAVAPGDARVFVNEVHYDNEGTDVGEAIEIAGPAGTDLTGWSIVLYNGTGGAAYGTRGLSGTIPDQQAGFRDRLATPPARPAPEPPLAASHGWPPGSPCTPTHCTSRHCRPQHHAHAGSAPAVGAE